MTTSKHKCIKHPHDRALIAFGSVVLNIMHHHDEWNSDTTSDIAEAAANFGLSEHDSEFRVVSRDKFTNPLAL